MRWVSSLPWLALVATLVAPRAEAGGALDARAERLARQFLAGWLERHPEAATALGDHREDHVLPSLAAVDREADLAWYRAQRDSLASIPVERLAPAHARDVVLALARARGETAMRVRDRIAERDPGYALRVLSAALETPIRSFFASPCSRTVDLRRRLAAVPEYLRDARLALRDPSKACTESALLRASALLDLCRLTLPDLLGACHESALQANMAESDSAATAAITQYQAWLHDEVMADAVDALPLGREALVEQLTEVAGEPVSIDSLVDRARQEWAPLADEHLMSLDTGTERIGPDSAASILGSIRVAAGRSGEFDLLETDRIDVGSFSPPVHGERLVALGPWDSRKTRVRVDVGPPASLAEEPDPMTSESSAKLMLAAEGVPGRALFELRSPAGGSEVVQAFGPRAAVDGWSRYVEAQWAERIDSDASESALQKAHERERLARAIAEVMLRVEDVSVDSVTRWLEHAAPFGPAAARHAALEAATEPRWMASTIALWNLRELRAEAERRANPPFDAASFHDAVIAAGPVPATWARKTALAAHSAKRHKR